VRGNLQSVIVAKNARPLLAIEHNKRLWNAARTKPWKHAGFVTLRAECVCNSKGLDVNNILQTGYQN
jgi:hypothetical protein